MIDTTVVAYWLNLVVYQITALISFTLGCVSIWKYYLKLHKLMKRIQHLCIFCSIIWVIAAIGWNINHLTLTACLFSNCDKIYCVSVLFAVYGTSLGYLGFILIFILRLVNLFQDTAFEIPINTRKIIQLIIAFDTLILFCSAILYTIWVYFQVRNTWFIAIVLFFFCLILYIIVSVILLKLMINKIQMFTQFTTETNININCNNTNTDGKFSGIAKYNDMGGDNHFDEKKKVQISIYFNRLTKRLIVLYSVALFSSLIIECILVIAFCLNYIMIENGIFYNIYSQYFRLLFMIDTIINSICLLLQSQNATKEYYHICNGCQKFIISCCMSNLNRTSGNCNCIRCERQVSTLPNNVAQANTSSVDE